MITHVTLFAGLVGLVFLSPVQTLSEALEVVAEGRELQQVPPTVAADALRQLPKQSDPEMVVALARVARAGSSAAKLRAALVLLLPARNDASRKAVQLLGEQDEPEGLTLTPEVARYLLDLAADDDDGVVAGHAARLVASSASARELMALIEGSVAREDRTRAEAMIGAASGAQHPAELIDLLAGLELEPWLARPVGQLACRLVARSPEAADALLRQVGTGAVGPQSCFVRGLGGVKFSDQARWDRAAELLRGLLAGMAGDASGLPAPLVSATLLAGGDLLLAEVVPVVSELALAGPTAVRLAALEALERVSFRDVPTVEFLIGLMTDGDPQVAAAAYQVLQAKTAQQLPQRPDVWRAWLASAQLPEGPPKPTAERLAERRQVLATQERVEERRQRRRR